MLVRGDRAALAALVRNLADNAVRYAPPGARVEVRVGARAATATLSVDDAGPGIPDGRARARVRPLLPRAPQGGEPGSGLGLAIVQSVASATARSVTLGDSPLGGLRAVVRFAVAPPRLNLRFIDSLTRR